MSRLSTDNIKVTWKIFALFVCVGILSVESRNEGFDSGQRFKLGVAQDNSYSIRSDSIYVTIGTQNFLM